MKVSEQAHRRRHEADSVAARASTPFSPAAQTQAEERSTPFAVMHSLSRIAITRTGESSSVPQQENTTGLPDDLKGGIESLSGLSLADVRVHYASSRPAQADALAYTEGTEIHMGPGQEQHLAHEAWHVVQQKQGRVKPTLRGKGVKINDNPALEQEADSMGTRATAAQKTGSDHRQSSVAPGVAPIVTTPVIQYAKKHKRQKLSHDTSDNAASSSSNDTEVKMQNQSSSATTESEEEDKTLPDQFDYETEDEDSASETESEEEEKASTNQFAYDTDDENSMKDPGRSKTSATIKRSSKNKKLSSQVYNNLRDAMLHAARAIRVFRGEKGQTSKKRKLALITKHPPILMNFSGTPFHFEIQPNPTRKDVVVHGMKRSNSGDSFQRSSGRGKSYKVLAKELDKITNKYRLSHRIMNNIIADLMANKEPEIEFKDMSDQEEIKAAKDEVLRVTTEMAAILGTDMARSSRAAEVIEQQVLNTDTSFTARFGGKNPTYMGAPKGGSKNLQDYTSQQKQKAKEQEDSEEEEKE